MCGISSLPATNPLPALGKGASLTVRILATWLRCFIKGTPRLKSIFETGHPDCPQTYRVGVGFPIFQSFPKELEENRVYITSRSGSLDRPERFRRSPTAKDVEAYRTMAETPKIWCTRKTGIADVLRIVKMQLQDITDAKF